MTRYSDFLPPSAGVQVLSSDPTTEPNATYSTGRQIWVNSTSGELKHDLGPQATAWHTRSPLNAGRSRTGGAGTPSACVVGGGWNNTYMISTEEYDGSSWATANDMIDTRTYHDIAGTQTAAFFACGVKSGTIDLTTREYDGTSWSSPGSQGFPASRYYHSISGTISAGLMTGGIISGNSAATTTEYNGSTWSSGGNLNTARQQTSVEGTQTASIVSGGLAGAVTASVEEYNGTSWSVIGSLSVARRGGVSAGSPSSNLHTGGNDGSGAVTLAEVYNGTSWSTTASMLESIYLHSAVGDPNSTLVFGGWSNHYGSSEYISVDPIKTIGVV